MSFLFPKLSLRLRQWYMPVHVFFGLAIFLGAVATALMGLTEKLIFLRYCVKKINARVAIRK